MNRKQKIKAGLMVLFMVINIYTFAVNNKSKNENDWFLARESDNISLYYRWIQKDGNKTREMKAEFTIDADISNVLTQFSSIKNYLKWAAGIKKCGIDKYNDSLWYTHTVMNYPWPLKQKDLVTKHTISQDENKTRIEIEAAPDFLAEINGIERVKNYQGTWQFHKNNDGSTSVDYRVVSCEKPVFPRFVQDPVIQKLCIKSFEELKQQAEKE